MSEDRKRILGMLAEGKIKPEEAEMLLDAIDEPAAEADSERSSSLEMPPSSDGMPRYLYVKITGGDDKVDVRVPLALLRAGLKLTSLIPPQAMDQINESMGEKGMSFDFNNLKPEDIDEIVTALREMEVAIDSKDGEHVRVWCA